MIRTVLVIGWVWPEPQSSAAGHHMVSLLRSFRAQQWQVVFACCAEPTPLSFSLASIGVSQQRIDVNDSDFDQWVARLQPDLVLFDRYLMEEQFGWRVASAAPNALRILDTEDLQCLRFARQQAHKAGLSLAEAELTNDISLRELASIWRCDLSLIISRAEHDLLTEHFGVSDKLLHYLPLQLQAGTELAPMPAAETPGYQDRTGFVTIGNFRHAPNWDSVLYLRELWPQVKQQLPQAEIQIYGAYMPPKARQLHNVKLGFHVHGWVEDARAAVAQARVCVAPLRFGAGQKGKLLLAMCAGTPSVTTLVGAESMVEQGWPGRVADGDKHLVQAMVEMHQDESAWQQAQRHGYNWLQQLQAHNGAAALIQRLSDLFSRLPSHRQANFIGAMLRHHHHKSTEYFSRWIETKNRLAQGDDDTP
ncbi:glycosyltransferase [Halioxenophilus aromaticivorans]|uniref:Glycosyltransferase family 4 protein n=1 Tax=Halioxenophilus aromaticivorans TaxID=1306992 RepID=A0AAV3TZC5_9ALTE